MRWTSSFLVVLALAGCATSPLGSPPVELLEDCPTPVVSTKTNGGLARGVRDLKEALRLCNVDKASLRAWQKGK
jgi:hypothetical protein